MEDVEKLREKAIYDFIVGKCQLLPKSYDAVSDPIHFGNEYAIQCGSTMEFYIRPLNSCANDIDSLIIKCDQLAFAEDFPVLPKDVSHLYDTIKCYKMESYLRFPGFVRLRHWGEMIYSWRYKRYEFNETSDPYITLIKIKLKEKAAVNQLTLEHFGEQPYTVSGPAVTIQNSASVVLSDNVVSLWCPQWPKEAQDWPKRPRNHGWPTIANISEVVQHGSHVVHVQHRACRDDELQWRLSFSVAEVILLRSWTKIQQIVYHMLRFFSQKELKQKDCPKEDEVLCTYHLKTLMMWTSEENSPEWWSSSSVIGICCDLLKKLSDWLKRGYCPNYFIPEANLFYESFKPTMLDKIERQLEKFCKSSSLCEWFLGNYILPTIPIYCKRERKMDIEKCLLSLTEYRNRMQSESMESIFSMDFTLCNILTRKSINIKETHPKSVLSRLCALRESRMLGDSKMSILPMPADVSCFTYFDKAVYCLNTAKSLSYGEISSDAELFEYVKGIYCRSKIVRCQYNIFPEALTAEKSMCQLLRAQELMKNLTGPKGATDFQLLSLISKSLLIDVSESDDSQSKVTAPAALVYLAALQYSISAYQKVIALCSSVLASETFTTETETVSASCVFFIDDVVRIVGFCLLCKKLNEEIDFNGRHIDLDLRMTAKIFAYYLTVTSHERISIRFDLDADLPTSVFPFDHFLLALAKRKSFILTATRPCLCLRTDSMIANATLSVDPSIYTEKVIALLTECALENIISFYGVIRKDIGIQCNTADCYQALYLYKCRKYDEMLQLCGRILDEPDLESELKKFSFANVLLMPPFDTFYDEDIQSLVGFQTLYCFLSPLNDDLRKYKLAVQFYHEHVHVDSLVKHYTATSDHFLGRHFLARYLKLICYIDCNHPYRKALSDFSAMKSSLPFEHIIRQFIRQRHRKIY